MPGTPASCDAVGRSSRSLQSQSLRCTLGRAGVCRAGLAGQPQQGGLFWRVRNPQPMRALRAGRQQRTGSSPCLPGRPPDILARATRGAHPSCEACRWEGVGACAVAAQGGAQAGCAVQATRGSWAQGRSILRGCTTTSTAAAWGPARWLSSTCASAECSRRRHLCERAAGQGQWQSPVVQPLMGSRFLSLPAGGRLACRTVASPAATAGILFCPGLASTMDG